MSWREPKTGAVSLYKNPPDKSTDNGILFSAVAASINGITDLQFVAILGWYEVQPGVLLRYPGTTDYCSHDDLTGAASYWFPFALRTFVWGATSDWTWPVNNWLYRIIDFPPAIKGGANYDLNVYDQFKCALAWTWNAFMSPYGDTSGKQLIWLKQRVCQNKGWLVKQAARFWRWKMMRLYPGGLKELFAVYYQPDAKTGDPHPFTVYGPSTFD